MSFDPRARMGRDHRSPHYLQAWTVSIHAPAWGATPWFAFFVNLWNSFDPRARMGRDAR